MHNPITVINPNKGQYGDMDDLTRQFAYKSSAFINISSYTWDGNEIQWFLKDHGDQYIFTSDLGSAMNMSTNELLSYKDTYKSITKIDVRYTRLGCDHTKHGRGEDCVFATPRFRGGNPRVHVISVADALRIVMEFQPDETLVASLNSFIEMTQAAGRFGYTRNDEF